MSALGETLATALVVSGLAACCLALLPRTPPRIRFAVAVFGLAAWLVPWGWIRMALPSSSAAAPLADWLGTAQISAALSATERGQIYFPPKIDLSPFALVSPFALGAAVAAAFVVGFVLFVRDCVALRRCLRVWRARSRPGEHLRSLLPRELASIAADIRIVEGSAIAAASGALRPTIWLGGRHTQSQLEVALVHEAWHVRARDPVWVAMIAAVRRAFWWNPLVAYLARQALLMIESACDHRCAAHLGKPHYMSQLASLLLGGTAPATRLVAAVGAANLDVQRLRLLGQPLRVRARDVALVAALAVSAAAAATAAVVEREAAPPAAPRSEAGSLPATPAGTALAALLRAAKSGDSALLDELLGAYTPQEVPLPLPHASRDARVVDILRSEPLRIEYVVESRESGPRYVGEIAVSDAASARITDLKTNLLAW
ncbi:MAG TPA: M56 family metallopeptidase [Gammaproteobacteria bacterium]|nr:M56 family metallopeptidase [Gammaproteobacteria bacterium]